VFEEVLGDNMGIENVLIELNQYIMPFEYFAKIEKKPFIVVSQDIMNLLLSYTNVLTPYLIRNGELALEEFLGNFSEDDRDPEFPLWRTEEGRRGIKVLKYNGTNPSPNGPVPSYLEQSDIRALVNDEWEDVFTNLALGINMIENQRLPRDDKILKDISWYFGWVAHSLRMLNDLDVTYLQATGGKTGMFDLYRNSA